MTLSTICITGASSGIGQALAERYAKTGRRLLLLGRNQERLEHVAERCRANGAEVVIGAMDVRHQTEMQSWLQAEDSKQPIDLLIINAGTSQTQTEQQDNCNANNAEYGLVDIHVNGMLNTLHPVLNNFKQRKHGQIAIMASMNAFVPLSQSKMYGAVKAALLHYARALRVELKKDNIKVNAICPGWVESRLTAHNRFPMPWMMSSEKAAGIIQRGIENNKAVIAFPWQLHWVVKIYKLLPIWLQEKFL